MTCDEVRELLPEHLLGTLEGPEDLEVRRHLRGCASCRDERMKLEEGVSAEQLERLSGPAGLDLGAATPGETALSILAEILAVRAGREGGRLRGSGERIHA